VTGRRPVVFATASAWLVGLVLASAQGPADRPPMAEEVFKNIQILKGIPVDQFMGTMGFFSSSTGLNCTDCHTADSGGDWSKYAEDNDLKRTARRMMLMVDGINRVNFGGRQVVTCNTCHRGTSPPNVMPSLTQLYAELGPVEPGEPFTQAPRQPSPDQILDKYLAAVGGAQRLAALTSLTAKGFQQGFDDAEKHPVEIFATAKGQRATLITSPSGLTATVLDGRTAWFAAPLVDRPLPVMALTGQELEGTKLEAQVFFPANIKQALSNWRVGFPTSIDDRDVVPVQGDMADGGVATLAFDKETGLLTRLVRYGPSPVGRLVTRVDYSDYRDVAGVKLPFRWTVAWLSGRSRFEVTDVQPNARIDGARFGRPR
jgi:photosynthetic reaction center cytochrome c subunit